MAPQDIRIDHVMKKMGLGAKQAAQKVESVDKEREAFIRRFFHLNVEDFGSYDLVLNMGSFTLKTAEEIVIQALKAKFPKLELNTTNGGRE